jgi:hypothetical protein
MKTILQIIAFIIVAAIVGVIALGALACGYSAGACNPIGWLLP